MNELERMAKYVERTKISNRDRYDIETSTVFELARIANKSETVPFRLIAAVFAYGRAKGYRAAKAEVQR